ncbi:MAG: lipid A-modifier LpxR family protein, partial [Alphaproteobacteria bacterium]
MTARIMIAALLTAAVFTPAHAADTDADTNSRITLLEENDSLYFNDDKHYTQGLRASYLGPEFNSDSDWDEPFKILSNIPTVFQPSGLGEHPPRRYAVFLGQSFFTPEDLHRNPPDPTDRPYGAWLYG